MGGTSPQNWNVDTIILVGPLGLWTSYFGETWANHTSDGLINQVVIFCGWWLVGFGLWWSSLTGSEANPISHTILMLQKMGRINNQEFIVGLPHWWRNHQFDCLLSQVRYIVFFFLHSGLPVRISGVAEESFLLPLECQLVRWLCKAEFCQRRLWKVPLLGSSRKVTPQQ